MQQETVARSLGRGGKQVKDEVVDWLVRCIRRCHRGGEISEERAVESEDFCSL